MVSETAVIFTLYKSNIDKFLTRLIDIILKLVDNGDADAQVFDKYYKVFNHLPCNLFNSKLILYEQVNNYSLDVNKLLIKVHKEYCAMVENKASHKIRS